VLDCENKQARVIVRDAGKGIPDDQLDRVFRPFYRLEASRSQATGGTGLGLAIVRQLAESNGWKVRLKNRAAGGLEAVLKSPLGIRVRCSKACSAAAPATR
jgi:two-component system osmolarity sensor histidine kinase EnvZ